MDHVRLAALAILALAPGVLACSKYSDARCNKANCEALLNCRLTLFLEPPCGSLPSGGESVVMLEDQISQACVDVCTAGGSGSAVQCVADNFPGDTCTNILLDGGDLLTTITASCFPSPCGSNCSQCFAQCNHAYSGCAEPCLKTATVGQCVSCSATCAEERARCGASCPTN